jgi:hypothetical protein
MTRNSPQDMIKMEVARDYLQASVDKDLDPVLTPLVKHGMKAGVKKIPQGRLKLIGAGILVSGPGTEAQNVFLTSWWLLFRRMPVLVLVFS